LSNLETLQLAYREYIEALQTRELSGNSGIVNIISNADEAKELRQFFVNDSMLDDLKQWEVMTSQDDENAGLKRDLLARVLEEMKLYSPHHRKLFDTVITDIFISPSERAKAGSTSHAIGLIWANPKTDYVLHDVLEMLIHELTHHALFIDELRHGHYGPGALMDKANWGQSAILNIHRPLDKVFHSAVVAMEIYLFRRNCIGHPVIPRVHPPSTIILEQIKSSIGSLEIIAKSDGALTARAIEIIDNMNRKISEAPCKS
jgi:hypothetical protein